MLDTHLPAPFRPAQIDREASVFELEANAAAFWRCARDCERWGLAWEAAEARQLSLSLRVRVIFAKALVEGRPSQ
jgi:hypothetical protein